LSTQISIFTRTPVPALFSSAMNLRVPYSTQVQQRDRPRTTATSHQRTGDQPQRPPTTSLPRVRIEGVRGSNPLSSTEFFQVRWPVRFFGSGLGSQCGSQVVEFRYGWGFAPWLLSCPIQSELGVVDPSH
jgi:hypothetical protein